MSNPDLLRDKIRRTKHAVDGLTVQADKLMLKGQYGDAAERFEQASQVCKELAFDLAHADAPASGPTEQYVPKYIQAFEGGDEVSA